MTRTFVILSAVLMAARSATAQANIRLNEVHLNPPNPDGNYEFIELKSITNGVEACTGLSIIIIENDRIDADTGLPNNPGEISEVFSLNDLSTGTNGLLLLGNGYTASPRGGPWSGFVDAATVVADPQGMGDSDIGANDGLTILLVSGLTALKDQDVDVDNDNLLDWAQPVPPANRQFNAAPWTALIDSIGTRDRGTDNGGIVMNPYTSSLANISQTWITSTMGNRDPDTMARHLAMNTASRADAWYGGKLAGATSSTLAYQATRIFGPGGMLGEVTPGRPNLAATLPPTSFRINEIGLNPSGDNDRFQYIEIINTGTAANPAPTARNLNGFWILLVDSYDGGSSDDEPGGGLIIEKWDLSSMATGTNGLLLIGDDFSSSYNPFHDLPSSQTGFGDPEQQTDGGEDVSTGFGEGDIRFKNGLTLLLVQNFVDPPNDDLDAGNDGVADVPLTNLWTIIDQVGFTQVGKTGLGRTYSTVDLRTVMPSQMVPDNLSRKAGDISTGTGAWYGGEYEDGSPGFNVAISRAPVTPAGGSAAYDPWFGGFRGTGTPGLPNLTAPVNPVAPPVASELRISEVMIDPTNAGTGLDDTNEYIELTNTRGALAYLDGLWVIVVDLGSSSGTVVKSFPLDGRMTGLNGIALFGGDYNSPDLYPYRNSDGPLPPFSAAIDPTGSADGNALPNNGSAVLLIRSPKTGPGDFLTLSADGLTLTGDLDPDDDGVFPDPSAIAAEVVDSISVAGVNPGSGYGWISTAAFTPHHVARYPSDTAANKGTAFHSGQISQSATDPSLAYTGVWAGAFKGAGSPGRPNHAAPTGPVSVGSVVINEVHLNPPGGDGNFEFVELADVASRSRSLNGYYLLMFDNVGPNTGAIRHFWSLDGMSTGDNGLLLIGNRYYPAGPDNPWSTSLSLRSRTGDPAGREGLASSFGDGVLGDETDNLNAAFLLVRGFDREIGYDIDTQGGVPPEDSPGDGVIDDTPWADGLAGIHDSIMFRDFIATTPPPVPAPPHYPWDGFSYGLADLSTAFLSAPNPYYHPETFARFQGEMTPNSVAAWYGGDLEGGPDGNDGSSVTYVTGDPTHPPFPAGFTGRTTPGQPNLLRNANGDPDNDGIPTFMELAVAANPAMATVADETAFQPVEGTVSIGGVTYATISYRRLKGGSEFKKDFYVADNYTYTIETSTDLQTWVSDGSTIEPVGPAQPNSDGLTETATYRLTAPLTGPAGRALLRLRIGLP